MRLLPNAPVNDYTCKNIFNDTTERWVCRLAETAYENNIYTGQPHEGGIRYFA